MSLACPGWEFWIWWLSLSQKYTWPTPIPSLICPIAIMIILTAELHGTIAGAWSVALHRLSKRWKMAGCSLHWWTLDPPNYHENNIIVPLYAELVLNCCNSLMKMHFSLQPWRKLQSYKQKLLYFMCCRTSHVFSELVRKKLNTISFPRAALNKSQMSIVGCTIEVKGWTSFCTAHRNTHLVRAAEMTVGQKWLKPVVLKLGCHDTLTRKPKGSVP